MYAAKYQRSMVVIEIDCGSESCYDAISFFGFFVQSPDAAVRAMRGGIRLVVAFILFWALPKARATKFA
jgi:hypothetical protein